MTRCQLAGLIAVFWATFSSAAGAQQFELPPPAPAVPQRAASAPPTAPMPPAGPAYFYGQPAGQPAAVSNLPPGYVIAGPFGCPRNRPFVGPYIDPVDYGARHGWHQGLPGGRWDPSQARD